MMISITGNSVDPPLALIKMKSAPDGERFFKFSNLRHNAFERIHLKLSCFSKGVSLN
jgi:hypothetical protein